MDNRFFRDAMGKFATGITVVTKKAEDEIIGMTVNAFMSVSLDPKLIAISIGENARLYNKLDKGKRFGLSILKEDQKDMSMIFAKQMQENEQVAYKWFDDIPVIEGAIGTLSCRVNDITIAGDHKIIIAEVNDINLNKGNPLLYFRGQYKTIK